MRSRAEVNAARELAAAGASATAVARELGLPRSTVRDWLAGQLPRSAQPPPAGCGVVHLLHELPPEYVYLLGLYLGDGCLSSHPRGVYRLRIFLDAKYPGIITRAAGAGHNPGTRLATTQQTSTRSSVRHVTVSRCGGPRPSHTRRMCPGRSTFTASTSSSGPSTDLRARIDPHHRARAQRLQVMVPDLRLGPRVIKVPWTSPLADGNGDFWGTATRRLDLPAAAGTFNAACGQLTTQTRSPSRPRWWSPSLNRTCSRPSCCRPSPHSRPRDHARHPGQRHHPGPALGKRFTGSRMVMVTAAPQSSLVGLRQTRETA